MAIASDLTITTVKGLCEFYQNKHGLHQVVSMLKNLSNKQYFDKSLAILQEDNASGQLLRNFTALNDELRISGGGYAWLTGALSVGEREGYHLFATQKSLESHANTHAGRVNYPNLAQQINHSKSNAVPKPRPW